ncbi:hypothetical protein BH10PAT3_BH10PAT3_8680 [soil metagenome]
MEEAETAPVGIQKLKNPAMKWLYIGIAGAVVCIAALIIGAVRGGPSTADALPPIVLKQVFGFTPYYFKNNSPPAHLRLQTGSPKFFGNALTFSLKNSKNQSITVSEQSPDSGPAPKKVEGEAVDTDLGSATIGKVSGGHLSASVTTKDKTYILLESSDLLNSGTMKDIFDSLIAIDKTTGAPVIAE